MKVYLRETPTYENFSAFLNSNKLKLNCELRF